MQETIDEASEGLELPKQDYTDHCFVFSYFLMYVFYKRAPLFNEKGWLFNLDESHFETIRITLVFILKLCGCCG